MFYLKSSDVTHGKKKTLSNPYFLFIRYLILHYVDGVLKWSWCGDKGHPGSTADEGATKTGAASSGRKGGGTQQLPDREGERRSEPPPTLTQLNHIVQISSQNLPLNSPHYWLPLQIMVLFGRFEFFEISGLLQRKAGMLVRSEGDLWYNAVLSRNRSLAGTWLISGGA